MSLRRQLPCLIRLSLKRPTSASPDRGGRHTNLRSSSSSLHHLQVHSIFRNLRQGIPTSPLPNYYITEMSASAAPSAPTTKRTSSNPPTTTSDAPQKQPAALEEDDEFEDFPIEGGYPFPKFCPPPPLSPTLVLDDWDSARELGQGLEELDVAR